MRRVCILQYLLTIDNANAILNWVIVILYIKYPTSDEYKRIVLEKAW